VATHWPRANPPQPRGLPCVGQIASTPNPDPTGLNRNRITTYIWDRASGGQGGGERNTSILILRAALLTSHPCLAHLLKYIFCRFASPHTSLLFSFCLHPYSSQANFSCCLCHLRFDRSLPDVRCSPRPYCCSVQPVTPTSSPFAAATLLLFRPPSAEPAPAGAVNITSNFTINRTIVVDQPDLHINGNNRTITESGSFNMLRITRPGVRLNRIRFQASSSTQFRTAIAPLAINLQVIRCVFLDGSGGIRNIGEPPRGLRVRNCRFTNVTTGIAFNRDVVRISGPNKVSRALDGRRMKSPATSSTTTTEWASPSIAATTTRTAIPAPAAQQPAPHAGRLCNDLVFPTQRRPVPDHWQPHLRFAAVQHRGFAGPWLHD